jgi:hypothetical protein
MLRYYLLQTKGRAETKAVLASFPSRRPGLEPRSGTVADKATLGQVFSEYFGFPCQSFYRLLHAHLLSSEAGILVQIVADVPSGFSLTPPQKRFDTIFFIYGM